MSTESEGTNNTEAQSTSTATKASNPMSVSRIKRRTIDRLQFEGHTIEQYEMDGVEAIRVIEPDGTVFDNMVFGPTAGQTLAEKLAHHRKGKPKETPQLTDRERIEMLEKRVKRLEDLMNAPPEKIDIPAFLKPPEAEMNFHDEFIAREALDGEERQDTVARLQLQFEKLTNYSYVRALEDAEQARLSELTTNLRLGG
jgi:hypothetical protein